jgi:hypothetical protein
MMTIATLVNRGDFADILDLGDDTVVKAFRHNSHTKRQDVSREDEDLFTRGYFLTEARAYEDLQHHPELEIYVPKFFGRIDPCTLDLPAGIASGDYVQGCGLRLERIVGVDRRISALEQPVRDRVEAVLERMQTTIRLGNPWDGCCFVPGRRAEFALIDFSTWDDWYDSYQVLERDGRLSDAARRWLSE